MQGCITHAEKPTRHRHLNEVVYKEEMAVKFETKLFTRKMNGIILGDMTRPALR
jgi:hypothetical protein